jgi:hypothetical protein
MYPLAYLPLRGNQMSAENQNYGTETQDAKTYRIEVRQYMTKPASEAFDFQAKWNDNIPMPMRVMVGTVTRETSGMAFMVLHGAPEPSTHCLCCGRILKHPVSLLYGIGPECGGHHHVNPFKTKEELDASYEDLKATMAQISWSGWVIKSAVTSMTEVVVEAPAPAPTPKLVPAPLPMTTPATMPVMVTEAPIPVYQSKAEERAGLPVCKVNPSVLCDHPGYSNGCQGCSDSPVAEEAPESAPEVNRAPFAQLYEPAEGGF